MQLKINIPVKTEEIDIKKIISDSAVKYGDKYEKPKPIVTVVQGTKELHFLNCSGISGFFGKQKSRKTFNLVTVIAAALNNNIIDSKLRGYGYGKQHFWFDTEQSKYYTNMIAYRVTKKINKDYHPENFHLHSIRRFTPEDKINIIEYIIDNTENLGLVVIDTLSDLVYNINDLNECNLLINKLMQWTDKTECHIACVLHINPLHKGDNEKPRGHLGTELQNRVESSILIEKSNLHKNLSLIKPRDFRGEEIEPYGIIIDEYGIPQITDIEKDEEETPF